MWRVEQLNAIRCQKQTKHSRPLPNSVCFCEDANYENHTRAHKYYLYADVFLLYLYCEAEERKKQLLRETIQRRVQTKMVNTEDLGKSFSEVYIKTKACKCLRKTVLYSRTENTRHI